MSHSTRFPLRVLVAVGSGAPAEPVDRKRVLNRLHHFGITAAKVHKRHVRPPPHATQRTSRARRLCCWACPRGDFDAQGRLRGGGRQRRVVVHERVRRAQVRVCQPAVPLRLRLPERGQLRAQQGLHLQRHNKRRASVLQNSRQQLRLRGQCNSLSLQQRPPKPARCARTHACALPCHMTRRVLPCLPACSPTIHSDCLLLIVMF